MNKSLKEYVTNQDWVSGEYIGTALVVVPKQKQEDFEKSYEFFEDSKHENDKYEKFLKAREDALQAEMKVAQGDVDVKSDENNIDDNGPQEDNSGQSKHNKGGFEFIKNKQCRVVVPESGKYVSFAILRFIHTVCIIRIIYFINTRIEYFIKIVNLYYIVLFY